MTAPLYTSYVLLWVLVIFQGLVLIGLVRTIYGLRRDGGRPADGDRDLRGYELPAFTARDLNGERVESWSFGDELTALLFISPSCDSCTLTLAEMEALNVRARGRVVVVCQSTPKDCAELADAHGIRFTVVPDEDFVISMLFRVNDVPTAVLISENRIQSYGHPMRGEEFKAMFEELSEEVNV